jgi:hypothetical protein
MPVPFNDQAQYIYLAFKQTYNEHHYHHYNSADIWNIQGHKIEALSGNIDCN